MDRFSVVGKRLPMIDGREKVTGEAVYSHDVIRPSMLYGKILRSPHPHALIRRIGTCRAEALPGVHAVVTVADTPGLTYIHLGPPLSDKYPLAKERVRYIGEEVAAVAAVDEGTAQRALELIEVEYEVLPAVFSVEEAMQPGAPQIHEAENNISVHTVRHFGDIEVGLSQADYIFEDRFSTQAVAHCCLETHSSVASFDEQGRLNIWTSTQAPYFVQKELAHVLQMSESDIRIRRVHVGGGFGSRSKVCDDEAICALLAKKSKQPVKIALTREEEFATTRTRHPTIIYVKTGVKSDGTLVARQVTEIMDNGAYNGYGPAVLGYSASVAASLYRVPRVKFEGTLVFTNKQYPGAFRGYGAPQITFAIESQMDMIADRLGMDRVAFRLKNVNRPGDVTPCGWQITTCAFDESIERAVAALGPAKKGNASKKRGVGIAGGIGVSGSHVYVDGDYTEAVVEVSTSGTVTVRVGTTDIGTWSNTTLAQVAAEELAVPFEDIRMVTMDTDLAPRDLGSFASRVAFVGGNAVRLAAADAKRQILEAVAMKLKTMPDKVQVKNRLIYTDGQDTPVTSIYDAVRITPSYRSGQPIIGRYRYETPTDYLDHKTGYANVSAAYSFVAQAVEVEVDCETGQVTVLGLVVAYDLGQPLNPMAVEGQIEGAVAQGIGYALTEQMIHKNGRLMNSDFLDYRILSAPGMPPVQIVLVGSGDPAGSFGAKGMGEWGLLPTAPAIANAVYDAIGARVQDLPITPEKVLRLLAEKGADTAG